MQSSVEDILEKVKMKLMHFEDTAPDKNEFEQLSTEEAEKRGFFLRDFGMRQWDWPQGVGIFGLQRCGGNDRFIQAWAVEELRKGLPTKNVNTICPMLTLADYPEFDALTEEWMDWIEEAFPRTAEAGLQHITSGQDKRSVKNNHQQIWIDTIFMTTLFMAKMGIKYDKQQWLDDSLYQILLHTKYLLDREKGLFYHGWNFEEKSNYGGNFWCRGNSWFTLGLPLYLGMVGERIPASSREYLLNLYKNQVEQLVRLQGKDHLWHTLLDDTDSYTETSGSAGILGGILLGINSGILDKESFSKVIEAAIEAIVARISTDGTVEGVSAGTAISKQRQDYKEIIQTPMVYGQAMTLIALQEYLVFKKGNE